MSDLPVQINALITGACDIAYAPITADVPEHIGDIIELVGDPDVVTPWKLFGATSGGSSYTRSVDSEEIEIDQRQGAVFEDITDITRTFSTEIAEISPEHLKIVENAAAIETIAAAAGKSAQKVVRGGSFDEFTSYRIAFIAQRRKSQGLVTEPGGATRGAYVVGVLYNATLSSDDAELTFDEGGLATMGITFKAFPDPALDAGKDTVAFFEEQPGTIAA